MHHGWGGADVWPAAAAAAAARSQRRASAPRLLGSTSPPHPTQPGPWVSHAAPAPLRPRDPPRHRQDIVAESHAFDVGGFVGTLREYLGVADPLKRQFLLGWLG